MDSPSSFVSSRSVTPSVSRSSSPASVSTPATEKSVLFDEDVVNDPLNITADDKNYVLVIGGLGYIGSHTVLELLKEGYNVVIIDDLSNSYRNVLDRIRLLASEFCQVNGKEMPVVIFHQMDYRSPQMRSVLSSYCSYNIVEKKNLNADLINEFANAAGGDMPTIFRRSRITGVIHFAAFKSVEESIRKPLPYYLNNVCGLVEILELLGEFQIKTFVFSSSATVYGDKANRGVPLQEEHCVHHEEVCIDPDGVKQRVLPGVLGLTSPYGRTKFMCESILADLAKADPSWSISALRYFNPVGCHESGLLAEDPRQKPSNLFPVITSVLTGKRPVLEVFGTDWGTPDGTAVRDFIHVQDLSRGHVAALAASAEGEIRQPFRTYNLGTGKGHTVREVVKGIEAASERAIPYKEVERRPGDVGSCVAAVHRAQKELKWRAVKSLADCSRDVWNCTRDQCP